MRRCKVWWLLLTSLHLPKVLRGYVVWTEGEVNLPTHRSTWKVRQVVAASIQQSWSFGG